MSGALMTLGEAHALLAPVLPDVVRVGDAGVAIHRVHSDTRSLRAGDLFVALRGERFDGHAFLPQARAAGAVAALAERGLVEAGLPVLLVADSRIALGALAAAWRQRLQLPLIAVTGSNGKTTVTQMIASILRAWLGDAAFATAGNFNNDIGVPLTLLGLRDEHGAAVVEIGMNHPGEIAPLAAMAAPTVALVNNAQREHLEFMADVASVARENGAVIAALGAGGIAVFPADDAHTPLWRELAGARRRLTFALDGPADIAGRAAWRGEGWALAFSSPAGEGRALLRVAGRHNAKNALAAAACAIAAGCSVSAACRGLESFVPVKGRSQLHRARLAGREVTLIDDSYNANPDSVRAAIDVLAELPGPRWLILGDMGEVGSQGPAFHAEVGTHARERGIEQVWTLGAQSAAAATAHGAARRFDAMPQLLAALAEVPPARSVVVKGSRFMKMEQVVAALLARREAPHAA